jgi:hypothetical protein
MTRKTLLRREIRPGVLGVLGLLSAGAILTGCGTDYEGTEERAAERARGWARAVEESLAEVASRNDAPTGQALVEAVRDIVPAYSGHAVTFELSLLSDVEASLKMAFDGSAESGGGGTYYQFLARLCVEYRVRPGADEPVTVSDTRCPRELLEPTGPTQKADRIISLED